jgi:hypothetical protein
MLHAQQTKDLRRIIGVNNAVDEEEFDQFDEIPPFITSMIKPRIPSSKDIPYLRNNHHEKVKNFKKPRVQRKVAKWLPTQCIFTCGIEM